MQPPDKTAPTTRRRHGRWIGGVCAGLATRWGTPVGRIRAAFALASAVLGFGALVYLAAWLILPAEGEDGAERGSRGIVLIAQACGALLGLTFVAGSAAVATVFGFGWVVVALAAAVLAATALSWPRFGPAWALLPIGALVLPSVAVAAGDVAIHPRLSALSVAPRTVADLPTGPLRSGLGLLEIDLRRTVLPRSGRIPLRIDAGVRRTLIALPHDRCVHVEVAQHTLPLANRVVSAALGLPERMAVDGSVASTPGAQVFGKQVYAETVRTRREGERRGPTLAIDFTSDGGGLVVRDYPDDVDASSQPDWPGYPVFVEARPDTSGLGDREARRLERAWRIRRAEQVRSRRSVAQLMAGPCARRAREAAPRGEDPGGASRRRGRGKAGPKEAGATRPTRREEARP